MRFLALFFLLALPALSAPAQAASAEVPGGAQWYLHIDLDRMRTERAGQALYRWLQREVFEDVRADAGVDIDKEIDRITAFALAADGPVVIFDGNFSQATHDMIMALVGSNGDLTPLTASGTTYYRFGEPRDELSFDGENIKLTFESLNDGAFVSTDVRGKLLITASEAQMQSLLASKGRVAGTSGKGKSILVLAAEKALLQAGMDSAQIDAGGSGWDSNILRNTEQIAFLLAAASDKLAVEARLLTTEASMAESLAGVVRGLISLASLDDEMEPAALAMMQSTRVDASGNELSIALAVDPEMLVEMLGDE